MNFIILLTIFILLICYITNLFYTHKFLDKDLKNKNEFNINKKNNLFYHFITAFIHTKYKVIPYFCFIKSCDNIESESLNLYKLKKRYKDNYCYITISKEQQLINILITNNIRFTISYEEAEKLIDIIIENSANLQLGLNLSMKELKKYLKIVRKRSISKRLFDLIPTSILYLTIFKNFPTRNDSKDKNPFFQEKEEDKSFMITKHIQI